MGNNATPSTALRGADFDARLRKLRYRAWHRGTKEMDLLLGPFADSELALLSDDMLIAFEDLLNAPDDELQAWLLHGQPAPELYETPLLTALRAFNRTRAGA